MNTQFKYFVDHLSAPKAREQKFVQLSWTLFPRLNFIEIFTIYFLRNIIIISFRAKRVNSIIMSYIYGDHELY